MNNSKFLQKSFFLLVMVVLICTLQACSDDENKQDPLIGNWYYLRIDGTARWEYTYTFEADGGFDFSGTTHGGSNDGIIWNMYYGTSSGKYKKNGKTLTIEYLEGAYKGDTSTYTIMSLNESNLVLKGESGSIKTFTRL